MHRSNAKYYLVPLCLLYLFGYVSSTGIWQDIVDKTTEIAKEAKLFRAGESCVAARNVGSSCEERNAEGILECNLVLDIGDTGVGVCQVKSWIIGLALALVIIIPLSILACICCCCCGLCGCCRSRKNKSGVIIHDRQIQSIVENRPTNTIDLYKMGHTNP